MPSTMTDCSSTHSGSQTSSTSSSSSDMISHGVTSRIRIIRLCRPNQSSRRILIGGSNITFGFSIRGGREFNTGFFVSRIEKGSEADQKGLRVGDQIIRANGYLVDDAVHKELSQFISIQDRLTLKVRGFGMLPVKERHSDPLTWHVVPLSCQPIIQLDEHICQDVRIILNVAPKTKLGLGICKGPEWKPGIFVQFTKEFGIARDAGLRPGDQLLSCNNIDFTEILFSEAVAVMKSSNILELIVRTGAGIDLFPGESSGYNSSASSITGDQSPCWGDQASKRLSIVKEEDPNERIGYLRPKNWERKDLDRRKERLLLVETPRIPNSYEKSNNNNNNSNTNYINDNHNNNNTINNIDYNNNNINNNNSDNNKIHSERNNTNPNSMSTKTTIITSSINNNNNNNNNHNNIKHNNCNGNINKSNESSNNTTIIKLSENATVINNTIIPNGYGGSFPEEKQSTTVHLHNDGNVMIRENSHHIINCTENNINYNNSINDNAKNSLSAAPSSSTTKTTTTTTTTTTSNSNDKTNGELTTDIRFVTRQNEMKTVIVEVHRNPSEVQTIVKSPPPPPPPRTHHSAKSPSVDSADDRSLSSLSSSMSLNSGSSLCSAISDELKKRAERIQHENGSSDNKPLLEPMKIIGKPICGNVENVEKHNALMDEFKKAHKKMFKNGFKETESMDSNEMERQTKNKGIQIDKDETDNNKFVRNGNVSPKYQLKNTSSSSPLPNPISTPTPDYDITPTANTTATTVASPSTISHTKNCQYAVNAQLHSPIPVTQKTTISPTLTQKLQNGTTGSIPKGTMGRCAASEIAKANGDAAEMESIESFKLTNPSSTVPRPPASYFNPQSSGPPTMKKKYRPVSVTIGEYPTQQRKDPNKFDFIDNNSENINGNHNNIDSSDNTHNNNNNNSNANNNNNNVSDRLRNELEKTLSRSNLKNKNDLNNSINNNNNNNQNVCNGNNNSNSIDKSQSVKTTIKINPPQQENGYGLKINKNSVQNSKTTLIKTQSNVEKIAAMLTAQNLMGSNNQQNGHHQQHQQQNKVTINIPTKLELRKTESTPPTINGILKSPSSSSSSASSSSSSNGNNFTTNQNGGTITNNNGNSPEQQKNITFGNVVTTVIAER